MIDETLKKIESRIERTRSMKPETKEELRELVRQLKSEVHDLSESDIEHARSIANFTDVSTHEATRELRNEGAQKAALEGLAATVAGFEEAHPKLVGVVNRICSTLSNMGI